MNITLHIERLVLEGLSLSPGDDPLLKAAVEAELAHLLGNRGLGDAARSSGATYRVRPADIQSPNNGSAAQLGKHIAAAVYEGIGT